MCNIVADLFNSLQKRDSIEQFEFYGWKRKTNLLKAKKNLISNLMSSSDSMQVCTCHINFFRFDQFDRKDFIEASTREPLNHFKHLFS